MLLILTLNCQVDNCTIQNPLLPFTQPPPPTVDFRTQGLATLAHNSHTCSSWASILAMTFDTLILRNQGILKSQTFRSDAQKLKISSQFILSNTFGSANYCKSGSIYHAAAYMASHPAIFQTAELSENFPFEPENHFLDFQNKRYSTARIEESEYYTPFKYEMSDDTPLVKIDDVNIAKQYLARGIAVLSHIMWTNEFDGYKGLFPIVGQKCVDGAGTVPVLVIGYGKFKGVDCWIVQLSLGAEWGAQGTFYVEIGQNNLCIEKEFVALLPFAFEFDDVLVFTLQQTSAYELQEGVNGLDFANGTFTPYVPPPTRQEIILNWIIGPIFGGLGGLVILVCIILILKKKSGERIKKFSKV